MSTTERAKDIHWWLTAIIGGACAVAVATWAVFAYSSRFARAAVTEDHEKRLITIEAVLPYIREDTKAILEIQRQEQWRLHRIVVPDVQPTPINQPASSAFPK